MSPKLGIKSGDSFVVDGKADVIVLKKVGDSAIGDVEKILATCGMTSGEPKRVGRKRFWRR